MTTLNEIKEMSECGIYASPERVRSIIEKLMSIPMGTIFEDAGSFVKGGFIALTSLHGIDDSVLDDITYPELICLIENLEYTMDPEAKDLTAAEYKRFFANQLKYLLLRAAERNLDVMSYLGVGVSSLFDYLESRHNDREVKGILEQMKKNEAQMLSAAFTMRYIQDYEEPRSARKDKSVGKLLNSTQDVGNKKWNCWRSIDDYQSMILDANAVDMGLLISCIASGYRERMDICDFMDKYLNIEELYDNIYEKTDCSDEDQEEEKWQE